MRDILLANYSVDVRMSRTTDLTRSLAYRTDDANAWGANIFVSIHINSGGGTGFESYRYPSGGSGDLSLHNALHPRIISGMRSIGSVTDRGQKTANFHVLRESAMPAVLTENLFIDSVADTNLLKRADFITAVARAHAQGIAAYLGLATTPPPTSFSTIVDNATAGRFTASANWSSSAYSAQRYGTEYRFANPVLESDAAWFKVNIPAAGNHRVDVVPGRRRLQQLGAARRGHRRGQPDGERGPAHRRRGVAFDRHLQPCRRRPQSGRREPLDQRRRIRDRRRGAGHPGLS